MPRALFSVFSVFSVFSEVPGRRYQILVRAGRLREGGQRDNIPTANPSLRVVITQARHLKARLYTVFDLANYMETWQVRKHVVKESGLPIHLKVPAHCRITIRRSCLPYKY